MYQRLNLNDLSLVGTPGPLPADLVGLDDVTLTDLSWADGHLGYTGQGFWLVIDQPQTFDPLKKKLGGYDTLSPDPTTKTVAATHLIVDRPDPQPIQLSKIDFWRLFTLSERGFYEVLRKEISELSSSQLADSSNAGYLGLAIVFRAFDILPEFIELDHPETIAGLNALQQAGMLTTDRLAQVLAGQPHP